MSGLSLTFDPYPDPPTPQPLGGCANEGRALFFLASASPCRSEDKKPLSWRSLPRKPAKSLFSSLSSLHHTLEKSESGHVST